MAREGTDNALMMLVRVLIMLVRVQMMLVRVRIMLVRVLIMLVRVLIMLVRVLIMLVRVLIMLLRVQMIVLLRALIRSDAHQLPDGPHRQPPLHLRVRAQPICSHAMPRHATPRHATPRHATQAPAGRQRRARVHRGDRQGFAFEGRRRSCPHLPTYLPSILGIEKFSV
jgi:hypothetical protein